jgi:hypothetical protein
MFQTAHISQANDPELMHRAEAATLNRRIALVAGVVMAELWALTAAMDAWAEGRSAVLGWILAFQAVSFLLAVSITMATADTVPHTAPAHLGAAQPATD